MAELQAQDIHEAWTHKPHDAVSTGNHTIHLIILYILGCTRVQTWMLSMTRISAFRCACPRTTWRCKELLCAGERGSSLHVSLHPSARSGDMHTHRLACCVCRNLEVEEPLLRFSQRSSPFKAQVQHEICWRRLLSRLNFFSHGGRGCGDA